MFRAGRSARRHPGVSGRPARVHRESCHRSRGSRGLGHHCGPGARPSLARCRRVRRAAPALGSGAPEDVAPTRASPQFFPLVRVMVSRSHLDTETSALLSRLSALETIDCGSSLKFCRLAEGDADLYPRLAPTCEWDIAAGDALLAAAGGVVKAPDGALLRYGRAADAFRVPAFLAFGDPGAAD